MTKLYFYKTNGDLVAVYDSVIIPSELVRIDGVRYSVEYTEPIYVEGEGLSYVHVYIKN